MVKFMVECCSRLWLGWFVYRVQTGTAKHVVLGGGVLVLLLLADDDNNMMVVCRYCNAGAINRNWFTTHDPCLSYANDIKWSRIESNKITFYSLSFNIAEYVVIVPQSPCPCPPFTGVELSRLYRRSAPKQRGQSHIASLMTVSVV